MSDDLMPEPGPLAEQLDAYLERKSAIDALNQQLARLGREQSRMAASIQGHPGDHDGVGDDVVILFRGMAFVPFVASNGSRHGYDPMPVLDLDQLRKPAADVAGNGHVAVDGPKGSPR